MSVELNSNVLKIMGSYSTAAPRLACVTRLWADAAKASFKMLFETYRGFPVLAPYVEKAVLDFPEKDQEAQRVRSIYKSFREHLHGKDRNMEMREHRRVKDPLLVRGTLEPNALVEQAQWVEARTLLKFFKETRCHAEEIDGWGPPRIPLRKDFFHPLDNAPKNEQERLEMINRAGHVRKLLGDDVNLPIFNAVTCITSCFGSAEFNFLPLEIQHFKGVQNLHFAHASIKVLPSTIGYLINLEELNLEDSGLEHLTPEIGKLKELRQLNLGKNRLKKIPDEICQLQNLYNLQLLDNRLTELPLNIGNLTRLTDFSFSKNPLRALPPSFGRLKLSSLSLYNTNVQTLPETLSDWKQARALWTLSCHIKQMPSWIGNWTQLTNFHMTYGILEALPSSVGNLKMLTSLNLDSNRLTELPLEIGQLTALKLFSCRSNPVAYLPGEVIGPLAALERLDVAFTKISYLPDEINNLTRLIDLDVNGTQVQEVPARFLDLARAHNRPDIVVTRTFWERVSGWCCFFWESLCNLFSWLYQKF